MFYHASKTADISILKPHLSNHGENLVYLSEKKQNVLVYLSNAVEKHCNKVGFAHNGSYITWASYGFSKDGILVLQEYYPNATIDTYKNESGYIYSAEYIKNYRCQTDIPYAVTTTEDVAVSSCEYVPDAYNAILKAATEGKIILQKFSDNNQAMLQWIEKNIREQYQDAENHLEYREFLRAKFKFLK